MPGRFVCLPVDQNPFIGADTHAHDDGAQQPLNQLSDPHADDAEAQLDAEQVAQRQPADEHG